MRLFYEMPTTPLIDFMKCLLHSWSINLPLLKYSLETTYQSQDQMEDQTKPENIQKDLKKKKKKKKVTSVNKWKHVFVNISDHAKF